MYGTNATKLTPFGLRAERGFKCLRSLAQVARVSAEFTTVEKLPPPMHSCAVYGIVAFAGHSRRL